MYCIKTPDVFEDDFKIDQRVREFGTHFVIIKNANKFLDLICKELEKQNISFKGKLVNYYEKKKVNGEITLFDKTTEYAYQKEYRIILYSNQIKPVIIQIGDLRKIAEIFEIGAIDKLKIDWINKKMV